MKRHPTAADRSEFHRAVRDLVEKLDMQPGELAPDVTVVCVRAADFDPADNVLWELDANKSAVRTDVVCKTCKSQLAMSNNAYGRWLVLDRKPTTLCAQCMLVMIKGAAG